MKASNWHGTNGARVGKTVFLSGDGHTGSGMEMELPLAGADSPLLTLPLTHTNWSNYTFLRIRTFTDQPFEMPLHVTLYDGHVSFDYPEMPVGAPGWNEFLIRPQYFGKTDLTQVRVISIKDCPREVPLSEMPRGHFYLAEVKLIGTNDTSGLLPPAPRPPAANPSQLRVDLGRYFPAHLPVDKFRIFIRSHDVLDISLGLADEILFDPVTRSNFIAGIETQAATLRTQTNTLGIAFVVEEPRSTDSTLLRLSAFQSWLTNAYFTIGDLNGRWGTKLSRIEDVTWPTPERPAHYRDSITFLQNAVSRVTHDAVAAARRGAPRAYILGGPVPEFNEHGRADVRHFDYYTLQRNSGWSHYVFGSSGCGDSREFLAGAPDRALVSTLASLIKRRLWAVSFLSKWSLPENWLTGRAARWRDQVASRNLWLLLAAGMDGVFGEPDAQLDAAVRQIQPLWKVFGGSRPITRLGIIRSSSSRLMYREVEAFVPEEDRIFATFWGASWQPAVIYEETFHDFPKAMADYNVLALGSATHLPNWLQDSLLAWVETGGTLLCSEPPGLFDPWGKRLARLLWETVGIDTADRRTLGGWHINTAQLKPSCVILASDAKGEPLALRTRYGRGEIVMTLVPFERVDDLASAQAGSAPARTFRDEWLALLNERVKREIESPERNLYLDWRPCDDPRTFFSVAINLSPYAPVKTQVIAHGAYSRVLNLSADGGANPVPCERTESITSFPLELPPGGGAVLMLERAGKVPRRR
ncbi:MAG: hypothetical protein HZA91_05370 [Verrucomicrobia bacterium]|nr:hypothetical protein [Verrucomicrobiota bacterium]